MSRTHEPLWWALFAGGGVMAALFIPAIIIVTGFILPSIASGDAAGAYEKVHGVVAWWPVKIVLFGVVFLSLFHCAHRIRHTLMDLGMRGVDGLLKLVCYGGAVAMTVWAGAAIFGM